MKRIYSLLYIIALLAFTACEDGNDFADDRKPGLQSKTVPFTLDISPMEVTLSPTEQTTTTDIQCNSRWTASSSEQWCALNMTSGKGNASLTVTVAENTSISSRQATITVAAGDKRKNMTLTQQGVEPHTSASSTPFNFTAASATKTRPVKSNEGWTAKSSDSWCVVEPDSGKSNGTVTITVKENTSTRQRTATVTITGEMSNDKTEISVTQLGGAPNLNVSPTTLEFECVPTTGQTVTVTCNEGWKTESDATWCMVDNKTATGFTVMVEENQSFSKRTATITVTSDSGKTATVEVIQKANGIEREDYDDNEKKI